MSSANAHEWDSIMESLRNDELDVLLISPERLANPRFRDEVLPGLLQRMGMLVVDEAHCISDWGHDFRPDYRRIGEIVRNLPAEVPVLATTATANSRVVDDIAAQLTPAGESAGRSPEGSAEAQQPEKEVMVLRGTLSRESLRLGVLSLPDSEQRIAWLTQHLQDLTGSGIVYALTISQATDLAAHLNAHGYKVAAYTGQTDPDERQQLEQALKDNTVKALIATSALGMGFDKPDLGFVVHLGAPSSPETTLSVAKLEAMVEIRRSPLELLLKVLEVDGSVRRVSGGWLSTGRPWTYDAERYDTILAMRRAEQQLMIDYERLPAGVCRMVFLAHALDDDEAQPCGRCDTCAETWFPHDVSQSALAEAKDSLDRVGLEIAPRKQWPTGLNALGIDLKGKLPAEAQSQPGRALARLSDLGWGTPVREALQGQDAEVTEQLVRGAIRVLSGWGWARRPDVVVSMPSRKHPVLVDSIARALAEVGRLPYAGSLEWVDGGPTSTPDTNSAFRLAGLLGKFAVPRELAEQINGASVLLVDDEVVSRWTLTVAARELRSAGAAEVLPFALGMRG